jgi:hypothetical protein
MVVDGHTVPLETQPAIGQPESFAYAIRQIAPCPVNKV